MAALLRAVELEDRVAAWHLALGQALRNAGELPEAVKCLRRARDLDPDNVMTHAMLRDTLTAWGQTGEATEAARAVVSLRVKPDDYRALARLLKSQGQVDAAREIHRQAQQTADRFQEQGERKLSP